MAEIAERVSPFWTMWILVRISSFVSRISDFVFRISESGGMGEVAGDDAIGVVFGEGFIFEAAWNARACALRLGRVASQRTAPVASVTPIARPILKSFCISPTQNTNVREKGPDPFSSRGLTKQSVLLLLRGRFVDRFSCPY